MQKVKKNKNFWGIFIIFLFTSILFYKTLLYGLIPFPGDLLLSEYNPWRAYSYFGYAPGAIPSKVQYFDILRQIYPWKTFIVRQFLNKSLPLWNPHNFSGHPLMANSQSAVWYPMNIIYLILPQYITWTILVILQVFLSAVFIYLYTSKLKLSTFASLLSSTSFSLSLFTTVYLEYNTIIHVILWLPLLFYSIEGIREKKKLKYFILLSIGIIFSGFAGHFQLFGYVLLLTLIYGILRLDIKRFLYFLKAIVLSLGVLSIQLIPTMELINLSARSSHPVEEMVQNLLIQPYQLILFLVPDFFGNPAVKNYTLHDSYPSNALSIGIFSFIFAVIAIFRLRKDKLIRIFSTITIFVLLLIVRSPFTEYIYTSNIPFISSSSPSNMLFIISFLLSVLAGYGFDYWRKNEHSIYWKIIGIFGSLFIFILVFFRENNLIVIRNVYFSAIIFSAIVIIFLLKKYISFYISLYSIGVICITFFELFYFFHKFNSFVPASYMYPEAPVLSFLQKNKDGRIWGYGGAALDANVETQIALYSANGYDPLYPKSYGEFISSSYDGSMFQKITSRWRSDALIAPGYGKDDFKKNRFRKKLIDFLGVSYILDKKSDGLNQYTFPTDKYELIYEDQAYRVYKNKSAYPRVFLTHQILRVQDKKEFVRIFYDPEFQPNNTVLLEENTVFPTKPCIQHDDNAFIETYNPSYVKIKVNSACNAMLVLTDTYYPGWKAYIDDKEAHIYRAYWTFRAVEVPSGIHNVVFSYTPYSFTIGSIVTFISLGLFLLFILLKCKFKYESNK